MPGEATKIRVRVNNQSGKTVRSLKAKLVRIVTLNAEGIPSQNMTTIMMYRYPFKVKGRGGVFEGDLDFTFPLDLYPSSGGAHVGCGCATNVGRTNTTLILT